MNIDFDIMTKVQSVLSPELYVALCDYIDYREEMNFEIGYSQGGDFQE